MQSHDQTQLCTEIGVQGCPMLDAVELCPNLLCTGLSKILLAISLSYLCRPTPHFSSLSLHPMSPNFNPQSPLDGQNSVQFLRPLCTGLYMLYLCTFLHVQNFQAVCLLCYQLPARSGVVWQMHICSQQSTYFLGCHVKFWISPRQPTDAIATAELLSNLSWLSGDGCFRLSLSAQV